MASLFESFIPFDEQQEEEAPITEVIEETEEEQEEEEQQSEENPESDDRVLAIYSYLTESNLIDVKEDFKGKPEELEEILQSLPETMFSAALDNVHTDAQDLIDYAFKLGKDANLENLKKFFDTFVGGPQYDLDDEEQAYNYLKQSYAKSKVFKTEEKLNRYLDELMEDGELIDTAKEIKTKEDAEIAEAKKVELDRIKSEQEASKQQLREFYTNIQTTVDGLSWTKDRKRAVLKNMEPNEVNTKNEAIRKSPMALIQLADIYSRFNPQTGMFDLTDYEMQIDSKKAEKKREDIYKTKLESSLSKIRKSTGKDSGNEGSGFFSQFNKSN